ncbi:MAG: hypothetical protein U1D99_10295, partial [Candidatus Omnitrophota bacterium]|nr:hypothetical protein [Candidatus Omnitrophota bacterium]
FFSNSMLSSGYAWDMTVGTSHAEYLLEEMQTKETLADITRTDWPNWAQQQGLATLPQESFQVVYLNAVQDPLEIEVQVNWVRKGRNSNVVLKTKMTKQP